MPREVDKPQLFREGHIHLEPQSQLMELILDWAKKLPFSQLGVLDLAAGYGVEAKKLSQEGIQSIAVEGSSYMLEHGVHDDMRLGLVEEIEFPKASFGGILLKDTWVLLSPTQRHQMLEGVERVLVSNGSLLIISELHKNHSASYLINKDESDPKSLNVDNYPSFEAWKEALALLVQCRNREALITGICYQTTLEDTMDWAAKFGFNCEMLMEHGESHQLAQENEWIKTKGFIAKFTKV